METPANSESPTAILLDQHPLWTDAVERILVHAGIDVVAKTTSPDEALSLIEQHRPRIFVTGVSMAPGQMDGIACLRRALQILPSLHATILSARSDPDDVSAALDAGATAYVVKTAHPDDIVSAVRQSFGGAVFIAPRRRVEAERTASRPATESGMTRRELEILRLAAEGRSNAELARMLWVTEQTVKFHLSNIYRKLGVANRTEAGRWAQRNGLLEDARPSLHVA